MCNGKEQTARQYLKRAPPQASLTKALTNAGVAAGLVEPSSAMRPGCTVPPSRKRLLLE